MKIRFGPSVLLLPALVAAVASHSLASTKDPATDVDDNRMRLAEARCSGSDLADAKLPSNVATALQPDSTVCQALASGDPIGEPVRSWLFNTSAPAAAPRLSFDNLMEREAPIPASDEAASPSRGLGFDALMGSTAVIATRQAMVAPAKSLDAAFDSLGRPAPGSLSPELGLGNIEAGREAVKTQRVSERVVLLAATMDEACACTQQPPCFESPQFSYDAMNAAISDEAAEYEGRIGVLCADWGSFVANGLPEDRPTLEAVEQQLTASLATEGDMRRAMRVRADKFYAEERRIASAEAEARAQAEVQNKKKSGLFAAMVTFGAGAAISNSLGAVIDPDALVKTSVNVGKAVRNGQGVAGALDAGVSGFSTMIRTATPKNTPSFVADNGGEGNTIASAMSHVKRFPAPGSATAAASSNGSAQGMGLMPGQAAGGSAYADLLGSVGSPLSPSGTTSMPQGMSAASLAEGDAYLQRGSDLLNSGSVTPGDGSTDDFGVPDPIRETITYTCRKKSNYPLADGAGGVKYYYDQDIDVEIRYWIPECGAAKKAHYIAYGCNNIDDFSAVEAQCVQACGASDCRSTKYESQLLKGMSGGGGMQ